MIRWIRDVNVSLAVASIVIVGSVFGYLRDVLMAKNFGSSMATDIIFVALILPTVLENVLGVAIRDSVIPTLANSYHRGIIGYRKVVVGLLKKIVVGTSILLGLGLLFPSVFLSWIAPGWTDVNIEMATGAWLWALLLVPVQSCIYLLSGMYQERGRFIFPAFRTLLMNIGAIVALLVAPRALSGMILGFVFSQAFFLLLLTINFRWPEEEKGASTVAVGVREAASSLFLPLMIGVGLQQVPVLIERLIASGLQEGDITRLSFAFRLVTIPQTFVALSIVAVTYSAMSNAFSKGDTDGFNRQVRGTTKRVLCLLIPFSLIMYIRSRDVVELVFQRGAFGVEDSIQTAKLLQAYSAGLVAFGLSWLYGRVFVSRLLPWSFVALNLVGVVSTLAGFVGLKTWLGAVGLAWAYSIGFVVQSLVAIGMLKKYRVAMVTYREAILFLSGTAAASLVLLFLPLQKLGILELSYCVMTAFVVLLLPFFVVKRSFSKGLKAALEII